MGSLGSTLGQFSRPKGVAVDGASNVYVVDTLFDNVQIFNTSGELLLHFGKNGIEPGTFWLPAGIAVDRQGRIYVADSYNQRVQVFQLLEEGMPLPDIMPAKADAPDKTIKPLDSRLRENDDQEKQTIENQIY